MHESRVALSFRKLLPQLRIRLPYRWIEFALARVGASDCDSGLGNVRVTPESVALMSFWVKSCRDGSNQSRPLYPRKPPRPSPNGTSAKGHAVVTDAAKRNRRTASNQTSIHGGLCEYRILTRNISGLEALQAMSNFQSLLRRIPEPSIQLFVGLAVFGMVAVMTFAMIDGIK
jgi:hypothetical protein